MYVKAENINTRSITVWSTWIAMCSFVPSRSWITDSNGNQLQSLHGACFPTLDRIAERARCSRSSVKNAIRTLIEDGYVRSAPTYNAANGGQRSNRYTLYPRGNAPRQVDDGGLNVITLPLPFEDDSGAISSSSAKEA